MVLWRVRFPPILPTKIGDHKMQNQNKMESKLTFEYTYTIEGVYTSVFTSIEEYDNMSTEDKQNFKRGMRSKIIEEIENDSLPTYDIKVVHTGEDISYEQDI